MPMKTGIQDWRMPYAPTEFRSRATGNFDAAVARILLSQISTIAGIS
jgi:hypothetical protein